MICQPYDWLQEGNYIDFRDKDNNAWQVGLILAKVKTSLKVRSQGWSNKYDEFISTNSSKIKPFRSHVRGYTGQLKNPAIRDHLKYTKDTHQKRIKQLKEFIQTLSSKTGEVITQYLRGGHYFYIDFLTTISYTTKDDLQLVYDYFREHIKFTTNYLQQIAKVGVQSWCTGQAQNPNDKALRDSYYQIFDGMYILMAFNTRQLAFQKNNDKIIKEVASDSTHQKFMARNMQEIKLDQAYLKVLEIFQQETHNNKQIPISFLYSFFHLYTAVEKALLQRTEPPFGNVMSNKQERKKIVTRFFHLIKQQLEYLSPGDLKTSQNQKEIESLLTEMKTCYFKYGLQQMTFEYIQTIKLKTAFLMLHCDTLQRKLKGISKLKQLFQAIIGGNQFSVYKLSNESLATFIKDQTIISSLYLQNQHPEILKKGSELSQLFFRKQMVGLTDMLFIWKQCSHKHEAVRKIIYQLWIDITVYVAEKDIEEFLLPIVQSLRQSNEGQSNSAQLWVQEWEIELLYQFNFNFLNYYNHYKSNNPKINALVPELLQKGHLKLIMLSKSTHFSHLLSEYTKLINISAQFCNSIIEDCYSQISKNSNVQVNLLILIQFYVQSVQRDTYIPQNAVHVIFSTLQQPANSHLAASLFKLLDQVINFSSQMQNKNILNWPEFQLLWKHCSQHPSTKQQFYNWLIRQNSEGIFGIPVYEINHNIDNDLKSDIFTKFLCDHNNMDYFNFSEKELLIFKQFMLQQNQNENRLEVVKFMNIIKIILLKDGEITGNKCVWDIFLNCKNQEVIRRVSKFIVSLHFNFHKFVEYKVKKGKAITLMTRLQKHIKDSFRKGNLKLMNNSLILLKDIIDHVKQKPTNEGFQNKEQHYFKIKIKAFYQEKQYNLDLSFGVTYYQLKTKIAEMIKLDRTAFQLHNLKNQQIGLEYSNVPFGFLQEKSVKVVRVYEGDQSISKTVLNFIKDRIQNTLIDMLQNESVCQNVYNVLQQVQIKIQQGQALLQKLSSVIIKHQQQKKTQQFNNYQVYFHLFYLRILQFLIDNPSFLIKFINNQSLNKLVVKTHIPITSTLVVTYLAHNTESIFKIIKKIKNNLKEFNQQTVQIVQSLYASLKQACLILMQQICTYINSNSNETSNAKKIKIIFNCLNIIELIEQPSNLILVLLQHDKFVSIVEKIYLQENLNEIRFIFGQKLKKFIKFKQQVNELTLDLETGISKIFIRSLYYQIRQKQGDYSNNKKVIHFYKLISYIIKQFSLQHFASFVVGSQGQPHFYEDLLVNLQKLSDPIQTIEKNNFILSSHLNIIASIYEKDPTLCKDQKAIDFLLYDCLFFCQDKTSRKDVRCKKQQSIKQALQALRTVCTDYDNTQRFISVVSELQHYHRISYWRSSDYWTVSLQNQVTAKYVGLQNPGCICYLNSLLQQLFMIKQFRETVYSLPLLAEGSNQNDGKLELLKAMKQLFFKLEYSQEMALSPVFFTKAIKNSENKPMIKLVVQMDIDEFCSILFDRIQGQINLLPQQQNFIKNYFGGVYAHQIISKECMHSSEREQQFLSIGLEVKKNILQSFNALVKGEMLDGENKYFCEKCDKKVKAEKMLTIKVLPKNLILSLKRFQFNYQIDAKIKINDFCQFPTQLNLKRFSQQQINKANKAEKVVIQDSQEQTIQKEQQQQLPDEYFMYKLKGVVVHTGSADSGHYYSYIEDAEGCWFQFNDSLVSPFDVKNLPQQAFGCKDNTDQKTKNAYLIFYEKVEQKSIEIADKTDMVVKADVKDSEQNKAIIDFILHKNKTINKFRLLFSNDYSEFVIKIIKNISKYKLDQTQQQQWNKFLLSYFLLIKIRQGSLEQVIQFSKIIQAQLFSNKQFRNIFIEAVTSFTYLQQLFVYCSYRDKSKIMANLLNTAFISYFIDKQKFQIKTDAYLQQMLENIVTLTVINGNIYELQIVIRKIVQFFIKRKNYDFVALLVQEYGFSRLIAVNLFGLIMTKQERQNANLFRQSKNKEVNCIIGHSQNQGKKFVPVQTKQSWHLLHYFAQYMVKQLKQQVEGEGSSPLRINHAELVKLIDKMLDNSSFTRIIHECTLQKSVYHMYKTLHLLSRRDKLLQSAQKALKDFESTKYRPFMLLLYFNITDTDITEHIIRKIIQSLQRVHKANQKYFLEVNFIHQWIYKFVSVSAVFLKNLEEYSDFVLEMVNWIIGRPMPGAELLKKHKNPSNQKLTNRINGILVSADPRQYQSKSKSIRVRLQKILQKKFQLTPILINNDYLNNDQFLSQTPVHFFDIGCNKWFKGTIQSNNFSLLRVKIEGQEDKQLHFWQDCQRLLPHAYPEQPLPLLEQSNIQALNFTNSDEEIHSDHEDLYT